MGGGSPGAVVVGSRELLQVQTLLTAEYTGHHPGPTRALGGRRTGPRVPVYGKPRVQLA